MKTLADIIEHFRFQTRVARELGISRQTIWRWQTGRTKPSKAFIKMMAGKFVDVRENLVKPSSRVDLTKPPDEPRAA